MPEHAEFDATAAPPAIATVRVRPDAAARHAPLEERPAARVEQSHRAGLNNRPAVVGQRKAAARLSNASGPRPPLAFVTQLAAARSEVAGDVPIQLAKWTPGADGRSQSWDEVIEGVRWHADAAGDQLWFTIEDVAKVPALSLPGFRALEGPTKAKPWAQWNGMHWQKWLGYVGETLATTAAAEAAAAVTKKDALDLSKIPVASKRGADDPVKPQVVAGKYFQEFKVITRDEFNPKITEIAQRIVELGSHTGYSCVVSEGGKSNYWVTAKVLDQVHKMGGASPRRIISVPAKETGERVQQFRIDLKGAGELVFLDDGAYSGAQLQKFIAKTTGNLPDVEGAEPHAGNIRTHVGLVAMSDEAQARITPMLGKGGILNAPIKIAKSTVDPTELNELQSALDINVEHDPHKNPDGNYTTAFYYKLPDYASVRHQFLLKHALANAHGTNAPSYSAGQPRIALSNGVVVQAGKPGTEPYKTITTTSGAVESYKPPNAGGGAAPMGGGGQIAVRGMPGGSSSSSLAPRTTSSSSSALRPFSSARPVSISAGSMRNPMLHSMVDELALSRTSGGAPKLTGSAASPGSNSAQSKTPDPTKKPPSKDGDGAL